jgi:hypothetical protein
MILFFAKFSAFTKTTDGRLYCLDLSSIKLSLIAYRAHYITSLFSCVVHRLQINLVSVGNRVPGWVQQGYLELEFCFGVGFMLFY